MQVRGMTDTAKAAPLQTHSTVFAVLFAVGFCHALNDMMQSLLAAIYPNLKATFDLDFAHVGLITLVYQVTASLLLLLVKASQVSALVEIVTSGRRRVAPSRTRARWAVQRTSQIRPSSQSLMW